LTEETLTAPFRATLKGQGQTDPWTTIEGINESVFVDNLSAFLPDGFETDGKSVPEIVAAAAAEYVRALNAQSGISAQRDRPVQAPPAQQSGATPPTTPRPGLSSSLRVEDDGNYWITLPYQRNRVLGDKQREHAKALGARYKPDDAPASIPLTSKGAPERPWCVHQRFVSEENVAELLRLHETGFSEIK
jgi:hypothetical protein